MWRSTADGRTNRGVTTVEVAIVLPLLLLLVFGIIEFGLAWFDKQSVTQGVREAARQGIVATYDGGIAACASGSPAQQLACVADKRIDIEGVRVSVVGPSNPDEVGKELTVCAAVEYDAITGLLNPFLDGRELASSVSMRVEQDPDDSVVTIGSHDLNGGVDGCGS
ncbi:MAG TPA: TadE family protein [Vicinamibacterales bacterium]|nr:TadE family protein [Vicinamibacterales bacterium]